MFLTARHLRLALLPVLATALASVGCSGTGTVSGKVTFQNAPMPGGRVVFHFSKETTKSAEINPTDGTYSISGMPTGLAKVSVQPIEMGGGGGMRPGMPGGGGAGGPPKDKGGPPKGVLPPDVEKKFDRSTSPAKAVNIPGKYRDADQSGLSLTVKGGSNPFDIDIK
jgi:hypothetical protein